MARAPRTGDELDFDASPAAAPPPWLQPVPARAPRPVAKGKAPRPAAKRSRQWVLYAGVGLLAMIVVVAWILFARGTRSGGFEGVAGGDVPLIRAPTGPYKVRPADPGGLRVDEADSAVFAAGEGVDTGGRIATEQAPEDPVARPGSHPAAPPTPKPQD